MSTMYAKKDIDYNAGTSKTTVLNHTIDVVMFL